MTRGRILLAVVLLTAGAAGAWWWFRPAPPTPPMPQGIQDAEIRQAIEEARQAVLDWPRSAATWGQLGKVLLAHLFPDEADACFAEAARLAPDDPLWPYARGLIALKRQPEKGVPLLRQAIAAGKSSGDRPAMSLQLAEALLERGESEEAEKIFRADQELTPGNARSAFGLGLLAKARGDEPAATKFLKAAQDSPYARKRAVVQLAALARGRGDKQAAAAHEREATALPADPPWPDPLLDEVVELQVGRRGRERRASLLEQKGRYADAAQLYLDHLAKEPATYAYLGAGINLARIGDFDRALPLLREAVRREPDRADGHYNLAVALFSRASLEAAKSPGSEDAKDGFRQAAASAKKAAGLRPDHAQAYLFWGRSLRQLGEHAAAVEPFRKGVACAPADLDLQLGLGEVLLEVGRLGDAAAHLENARQLAPDDPRPSRLIEQLRSKKLK
jgi:tetratricopeptide (TPR) repeat protein